MNYGAPLPDVALAVGHEGKLLEDHHVRALGVVTVALALEDRRDQVALPGKRLDGVCGMGNLEEKLRLAAVDADGVEPGRGISLCMGTPGFAPLRGEDDPGPVEAPAEELLRAGGGQPPVRLRGEVGDPDVRRIAVFLQVGTAEAVGDPLPVGGEGGVRQEVEAEKILVFDRAFHEREYLLKGVRKKRPAAPGGGTEPFLSLIGLRRPGPRRCERR